MKKRKITIIFNSPVVLSFALVSLLLLIIDNTFGGRIIPRYFSVYRSSLADPFTYLRFFTHVLGHASYSHYLNNMLLMLVVGPSLEEKYGSDRMIFAIAMTALATGVAQFLLFPRTALLGASGVVFMMIVMSSYAGARNGEIPLTLILVFVLYVGQEVFDAIFKSDSISQLSHIIGGICGAAIGFVMTRKRRR